MHFIVHIETRVSDLYKISMRSLHSFVQIFIWLLSDSKLNPNSSPWTTTFNVGPYDLGPEFLSDIFHFSPLIFFTLSNLAFSLFYKNSKNSSILGPLFSSIYPSRTWHFYPSSWFSDWHFSKILCSSYITIVAFPNHLLNTGSILTLFYITTVYSVYLFISL